MITFTDIFIRRPVLSIVISFLIFFFGLRALLNLQIRQFPEIKNTSIYITTSYPGADAALIQSFITVPIEKAVAGAEGVEYVTSTSSSGKSEIIAHIRLNFDPNIAFTNISSEVASIQDQLPRDAQKPVIVKSTGIEGGILYLGFLSTTMSIEQITDYINRVVLPKLQTVPGVGKTDVSGGSVFAMRVWLNPERMAALKVTPTDVSRALQEKNFQTAAGSSKGEFVAYSVTATTGLHSPEEFESLTIKTIQGTLVRLKDVATVSLGAEDYDSSAIINGFPAAVVGITPTPTENPLSVAKGVKNILPDIQRDFPPTLKLVIAYDASLYIQSSINEILKSLIEASVIVSIVIFCFLGNIRAITIPIVTIPLCLVGIGTILLILNYSINTMTLLAMVLAIGLVVDDAIVVLENIHRHIEQGYSPLEASLLGAREIAIPIIAMTITLAAVYAPVAFLTSLVGIFFKEFAVTLAATVLLSGVIALILSPMMCSQLLTSLNSENRFSRYLDSVFEKYQSFYKRCLHEALNQRIAVLAFIATAIIACILLYSFSQKELASNEDQGMVLVAGNAQAYTNVNFIDKYNRLIVGILKEFPDIDAYYLSAYGGGTFGIVTLKPWDQRKYTEAEISSALQNKISDIAGLNAYAFEPSPLPVSQGGLSVQFVLTSTAGYPLLYTASRKLLEIANKSDMFQYIDSSLNYNNPQYTVEIDKDKAAELGISMEDIGTALATALGGNYTNFFNLQGKNYQVIAQVLQQFRLNPDQIANIYVKTSSDKLVPLSTIIKLKLDIQPNSLTKFQQLNSVTISGYPAQGKTIGDALEFLKTETLKNFPKIISYDYDGDSRLYMQQGSTLLYTFFFSLLVIFLVLAAQYESFIDPLIILFSVPMSICGALIPIFLGFSTINIYTQLGLITLIGLISKHGILMVDFANRLQREQNLDSRAAIEQAATIRLRPILMTTAAMVFGVLPLLFATGAGSRSRYDLGLVLSSGLMFGTLCTLFVVPTMYTYLATSKKNF